MTINVSSLPTPWPIGLIGILISTIGIFTYKSRRISLNLVTKAGLICTLIRSIVSLVGSLNSLRVNGLSGNLQYPPLSFVTTFSILATWDTLYNWDKFDRTRERENVWRQRYAERMEEIRENFGGEEIELQDYMAEQYRVTREMIEERDEEEARIRNEEEDEAENGQSISDQSFEGWRCVFIWLSVISFGWQIFSFFQSTIVGQNYQFTTHCSEVPKSNETDVSCSHQDSGYTCQLSNSSVWLANVLVGDIAMILPLLFMLSKCCWSGCINCEFNCGRVEKGAKFGRVTLMIIAGLSIVYLMSVGILQSKSPLNIQGIEGICDINPSLLSSKSGYLSEWWESKLNTARKISLL